MTEGQERGASSTTSDAPDLGNVLDLPFDQYQRYRLVADLINSVRDQLAEQGSSSASRKLRVLDVGGRTALLRRFLDDQVVLVDVEESEEAGLILGSGGALPFQDNSFDAVCAFDTLEHVPPAFRDDFAAECVRVCSGFVFLAGPYQTERVEEAEEILQDFLKKKLQFEHRYLEEHRDYGLPDRGALEAKFKALGSSVQSVGHANLERWLALISMSMYMDCDAALRPLGKRVHRFYNDELYTRDHEGPVYRHVVVACKPPYKLPDWQAQVPGLRSAEGQASAVSDSLLGAMAPLLSEMACFDRERDAWKAERVKWSERTTELEEDLAGHVGNAETLQSDCAKLKAGNDELIGQLNTLRGETQTAVSELQADLQNHRDELANRDQEMAKHREQQSEITNQLEAHQAVARDLEQQLEAHKQVKTTLETDLAEHRKVVTELGERSQELTQVNQDLTQLSEERGVEIEALGNQLVAMRAQLSQLDQAHSNITRTLALREEEVSAMQLKMRSRMANLKRALSPGKRN